MSFKESKEPEFSYDAERDPTFLKYKEQMLKESGRAQEDTLGRISAQTGGLANSYAATAAAQQGQMYAERIADKIPELEQQAYQRYLNELTQYNADRQFNYGQLKDQIVMNETRLGKAEQQNQNAKLEAQNIVALKLAAGVSPTDAELTAAGYDRTYADGVLAQNGLSEAQNAVNSLINAGVVPSDDRLLAAGYTQEEINNIKALGTASDTVTEEAGIYERMYENGITDVDAAVSWLLAYGYTDDLYVAEAIAEGYASSILPGMKRDEQASYDALYRQAQQYVTEGKYSEVQEMIALATQNNFSRDFVIKLQKLLFNPDGMEGTY